MCGSVVLSAASLLRHEELTFPHGPVLAGPLPAAYRSVCCSNRWTALEEDKLSPFSDRSLVKNQSVQIDPDGKWETGRTEGSYLTSKPSEKTLVTSLRLIDALQ